METPTVTTQIVVGFVHNDKIARILSKDSGYSDPDDFIRDLCFNSEPTDPTWHLLGLYQSYFPTGYSGPMVIGYRVGVFDGKKDSPINVSSILDAQQRVKTLLDSIRETAPIQVYVITEVLS